MSPQIFGRNGRNWVRKPKKLDFRITRAAACDSGGLTLTPDDRPLPPHYSAVTEKFVMFRI